MMYDKLTALLVCAGLKTTPVGGGRLKIGKPVPTHPHFRSTMLQFCLSKNRYEYKYCTACGGLRTTLVWGLVVSGCNMTGSA